MRITSTVFENNERIPDIYTCDGLGYNPPLLFMEVPGNVKSFVLIMEDPDAPGGTFDHWVVYDISAQEKEVTENSIPSGGLLGKNSSGDTDYHPPCPPSGEHRYVFKLYALDVEKIDVKINPSKEDVEKAMNGHILEYAELIGVYDKEEIT